MNYEMAKQFIVKNARPLEKAIFDYYFEKGTKEPVISELKKFQNPDGGFGNGLEADNWNPNSNPVATNDTIFILHRIRALNEADSIIEGIINYLQSHDSFDEEQRRWMFAIESNKEYPHAIWWEKKDDGLAGYNPTVSLAAFMVCFGENTSYYKEIIKNAFVYLKEKTEISGDEMKCYLFCYDLLKENKMTDIVDLEDMKQLIKEKLENTISRDIEKYGVEYVTAPSDFFIDAHFEFVSRDIQKLIDFEKENLAKIQKDDGGFDISWKWHTPYPEFEQARQWWRPRITINKMLFYQNF